MAATAKQRARLENWTYGPYDTLVGKVYGHPLFPEGEEIITSRVARLDLKTGEAVTVNTHYVLGTPKESE